MAGSSGRCAGWIALAMVVAGCSKQGNGEPRPTERRVAPTQRAERGAGRPTPGDRPAAATERAASGERADPVARSGPDGGASEERRLDPLHVEARLEHASHHVPEGAPHVVAHVPRGTSVQGRAHVVVYLHGWGGCARVLAGEGRVACLPGGRPRPGWGLVSRHAAAGTDTVFVVPQLAWRARDGSPGRLEEDGFFAAMLRELFAGPLAETGVEPGPVTLIAHSAGYESALAILEHGGIRVQDVALLDALYAGSAELVRWAEADDARRLVTLHTGRGTTRRESLRLARLAKKAMAGDAVALHPEAPLAEAVARHRVVVARSPHPHGAIPRRQLEEVLRALALP